MPERVIYSHGNDHKWSIIEQNIPYSEQPTFTKDDTLLAEMWAKQMTRFECQKKGLNGATETTDCNKKLRDNRDHISCCYVIDGLPWT